MKKFLTLLIIALLAVPVVFAGGKPKIALESRRYNFGYIQEDKGLVTHSFKVVNEGNAPLVIIDTRTSCGCTASTFTKQPIAPGSSGSIDVTYNPEGRPGPFLKEIRVTTNAGKAVKLIIEGVVVPKQ